MAFENPEISQLRSKGNRSLPTWSSASHPLGSTSSSTSIFSMNLIGPYGSLRSHGRSLRSLPVAPVHSPPLPIPLLSPVPLLPLYTFPYRAVRAGPAVRAAGRASGVQIL